MKSGLSPGNLIWKGLPIPGILLRLESVPDDFSLFARSPSMRESEPDSAGHFG